MKENVQKFGKFLSSMIMPNIGAFIAWGFITALFIPDGWLPNEQLASIQPFMLAYLLPIIISFTGGRMVGGDRGGVMGAISVIGCIAASVNIQGEPPMLMAAMVIGPFSGFVIKSFDKFMEDRMPAGFEMLINNFSVGIFGMIIAILGYYLVGPFMGWILRILTAGVGALTNLRLLPLSAILIEPAKVLFLNNAINHGIFTPIGAEQVASAGKSIMYMLEANPGPGLGLLIGYLLFSKDKSTRQSAPGAIIIHFFGGIHEIYFPYVLMNPIVIIGPILGNIAAITWYMIMGAGLKAPASPGSIIAFMSMVPKGEGLTVFIGVIIATAISFAVSAPIIRMSSVKNLDEARDQMKAMKAASKGETVPVSISDISEAKKIIFACDAGMGSSAMGATKFKNRVKASRPDLTVKNSSVDNIPSDCDIAVVQSTLVERAKKSAPQAQIVVIENFLADPNLDDLYMQLTTGDNIVTEPIEAEPEESAASTNKDIMTKDGILLNLSPVSKEEAIRKAGQLLVDMGCVEEPYIDAMIDRENLTTTYMGMGLAIPHGTTAAKGTVKKTGIVFTQYPDGVDFGDEKAQLVIGIAGIGDEHLDLLSRIATALEDEEVLEKIKTTDDVEYVLDVLAR